MPIRSAPPDPAAAVLLYDVRTELGMSQPDIADILGVTRNTISNWENHNPEPPTWLRYALLGLLLHYGRGLRSALGREKTPHN